MMQLILCTIKHIKPPLHIYKILCQQVLENGTDPDQTDPKGSLQLAIMSGSFGGNTFCRIVLFEFTRD